MSLSVGSQAPDFDVVSSSGERLRLADFRGTKNVVLYFYPGDFTPVCTRETCGFRDMIGELADANTIVIGVSTDSNESHERFAQKYEVPFPLVSDRELALVKAYDATNLLTRLRGRVARVTYVIDREGTIRGVFDSQLMASKHIDGVRKVLESLRAA